MCNSIFVICQSHLISGLFQSIAGISHGNAPAGKFDHLQVVFCIPKGDDFLRGDMKQFSCPAQSLSLIESLWHGFYVKRRSSYEDQSIFKGLADLWKHIPKFFGPYRH